MAEGKITNNPAFIGKNVEIIDSSFASEQAKGVTLPKDGYYFLVATTDSTSGIAVAALYSDMNLTTIISYARDEGAYKRVTTAVIPFKAGTTVICRAFFNQYARLCRVY